MVGIASAAVLVSRGFALTDVLLHFLSLLLLWLQDGVVESRHVFGSDVQRLGVPVEVSHRLVDGKSVQVGGGEGAASWSLVSQEDAESVAADGAIHHHGNLRLAGFLHLLVEVDDSHFVVVEHRPKGLSEWLVLNFPFSFYMYFFYKFPAYF